MPEFELMDAEDIEPLSFEKPKLKTYRKSKRVMDLDSKKRLMKGIVLSKTKPSYNFLRGRGSLNSDFYSLRWLTKKKLSRFLQKLIRKNNWDEASGVLSVLLNASCKDKSLFKNRTKYLAAMELLKHISCESVDQKKFQHVFETWMKKIGTTRGSQAKGRFAVHLEFILFCLTHGKIEDANQAVIWLMQEREFSASPISNFVVGLAFCKEWYYAICQEFPAIDVNEFYAPNQPEMSEPALDMSIENSRSHVADEFEEANYTVSCNSDTSVRIDKEIGCADVSQHQQVSIDADLHRETSHRSHRPQSFYVHSDESDGHEELSFSGHASILYAQGLEPWLLPSRLFYAVKSLDEFLYLQKKVHNDSYKGALKYLRLALDSTPPIHAALLPLVQMLLLGDQVKEAIHEVEKFASRSNTALFLRLKASLLDHFDSNNHSYLSTCFEDALVKDPTCTHSLTRLLCMHQNGNYSAEKLLGMVALHLDATYAECNVWKEFASCFLKLSLCEEDRISTCLDGNDEILQGQSNNLNRNPGIFSDGVLGKEWIFRCRWWMTRHFRQSILVSEFEAGDMQLLTYKAASACHLYGRDFEYVRKVFDCVEKDRNNSDMFSFLQMHMQNSVGFYHNFKRNGH